MKTPTRTDAATTACSSAAGARTASARRGPIWARRSLSTLAVLSVLVGHSGVSAADDSKQSSAAGSSATSATSAEDRANALFIQGVQLYKQQQWPEARGAFQAAWRLRQAYDIACDLGHTEMRLGYPKEAAEHLSYALRNWPITGDARARELAEQRLAEARREVGALRISADIPGAALSVDGKSVGEAPLSNEIFVLPGRHTVTAMLPSHAPTSATISVAEGESKAVTLSLRRDDQPAWRTGLLVAGMAVSAVSLGVAVGAMVEANASGRDARDLRAENGLHEGSCPGGAGCDKLKSALARQDTSEALARIMYPVAGATALATAIYFLWPRLSPTKETGAIRVQPTLGRSEGGAWVQGTF